ncbi:MAG: TetR/AcrR family transcriptional regulator [Hyphomicrobiales bacterium]|nr:TetR/AcrR family transcriptional regulator [Hyphomicrobiales bacterium]
MPWAKKFDNDEVLEKAMHAFWARGYEATSIQDLTSCMGINRGSIYATFKDKRNLFLLALEHYETHYRRAFLADLRREHSPRRAITALFNDVVDKAVSDKKRSGCLLVNTATEMSAHDERIAQAVANGLSETEDFFHQLIELGKSGGEIPGHVDAADAARALLGLLTGLRVLARSRPERQVLEPIARQAEALLN